jgi:hypothetical protein
MYSGDHVSDRAHGFRWFWRWRYTCSHSEHRSQAHQRRWYLGVPPWESRTPPDFLEQPQPTGWGCSLFHHSHQLAKGPSITRCHHVLLLAVIRREGERPVAHAVLVVLDLAPLATALVAPRARALGERARARPLVDPRAALLIVWREKTPRLAARHRVNVPIRAVPRAVLMLMRVVHRQLREHVDVTRVREINRVVEMVT